MHDPLLRPKTPLICQTTSTDRLECSQGAAERRHPTNLWPMQGKPTLWKSARRPSCDLRHGSRRRPSVLWAEELWAACHLPHSKGPTQAIQRHLPATAHSMHPHPETPNEAPPSKSNRKQSRQHRRTTGHLIPSRIDAPATLANAGPNKGSRTTSLLRLKGLGRMERQLPLTSVCCTTSAE